MTPLEAIQAATVAAAKIMGWQNKVGDLEPGFYADVIAVDGDPTTNIQTLEQIRFDMQGGAINKSP
jgi:imidazolonepropionase-like amidohydrolase